MRIRRDIMKFIVCFLSAWISASSAGASAFPDAGRAPERATRPEQPSPDTSFLEQYAATYRFRLGRPTAIAPAPDGSAVLFLRSGPRRVVQDLYELDAATGEERILLTADEILRGADENLPPEEKARRERKREAARGIVSFQLSEDGRRLLVPLAGRLFVIDRKSGGLTELGSAEGFPLDPQLSPDGSMVACVRAGDLFVIDVESGRERRLTEGASGTLTRGLAEFVAQEEMDRSSGYWWSPDSRRIAFQETDLSPVETLRILDPAHPEKAPDEWRYPRAGTENARVRLGVVEAAGGPATWIEWNREGYPYLAQVRWTENAPLTLLVQNRRQTEELLLAAEETGGKTRVLLAESDAAWLNIDERMPHWLESGRAFLWTTERNGAWQLERRGRDGKLEAVLTPLDFNLGGVVDADEAAGVVRILGGDDPTERHLFEAPLEPKDGAASRADLRQVTSEPGVHGAFFAKTHSLWVRTWSTAEHGPRFEVIGPGGRKIGPLRSLSEKPSIDIRPVFETVGPRALHAVFLRPRDFDPGRRYPVIASVYGGPHARMARKEAHGYLLEQWLANRGFIVVSIDGRGTPGRGREWERAIRGDLIGPALADQVEGLRALAAAHPEMDLARVGIYGWSFGGYFAAMAAMQRPDVFQAAVAGAPVADWRDYDTHYTERYLGLPDTDAAAYDASSALTYADRLERPLLIVHGTVDDNVYFVHSMKLCDALFRAGKTFEFLPLAGFTHMVPDPLVTERLYGRIERFFRTHLGN